MKEVIMECDQWPAFFNGFLCAWYLYICVIFLKVSPKIVSAILKYHLRPQKEQKNNPEPDAPKQGENNDDQS